MLIEKYMNVETEFQTGEHDFETYTEEVEVSDDDIRHYIDTYLSAEDVINFAKQIAPEEFKNNADLDFAYELLIDEFDEHDDIPDIADLNDYIQDCVQNDYEEVAREQIITDKENEDVGVRQSDFI